MNLKIPGTNIDFVITAQHFLTLFDVYDREDNFGKYLSKFDPNDLGDLNELYAELYFSGKIVEKYQVEHKAEVARVLISILNDKNFDYVDILSDLQGAEDYGFAFPRNWIFTKPRLLYVAAYRVIYNRWGNELKDFGVPMLAPETYE